MKKAWATVAILAVIIGVFFLVWIKKPSPQTSQAPGASAAANASNHVAAVPANGTASPSTSSSPGVAIAAASNMLSPGATSSGSNSLENVPSALPPLTVLDHARVVMHNYCSVFGENPVGTNPEITAALMGKNPKHVNFITPEMGLRVNGNGEMVDAWGTPFFFHQLSGKEMEIRSAGEDRKMWTFDDLVTR